MGIIFVLLGCGAFVLWYFQRKKAQATLSWPAAQGIINDARLVSTQDSDGSMNTKAAITYAYSIGAAPYYGNRISISSAGNPQNQVNRYRPGTQVQVFYDPANPASSVLERGASGLWVWPIVGAVAIVIGLVALAR